MILTRRRVMEAGGGILAVLSLRSFAARAEGLVEIGMQGRSDGSHVWFDPVGVHIAPGQTVRWTNLDSGNSHTTTAYSPDNFDRPRRIPQHAKSWNSDYLLPHEFFSVTFVENGVYDYYCIPHEQAGMVGRIVVGEPDPRGRLDRPETDGDLPREALQAFPRVEEIMAKGFVRRV